MKGFSKLSGYKSNTEKTMALEDVMEETIPFNWPKTRMKHLGTN